MVGGDKGAFFGVPGFIDFMGEYFLDTCSGV